MLHTIVVSRTTQTTTAVGWCVSCRELSPGRVACPPVIIIMRSLFTFNSLKIIQTIYPKSSIICNYSTKPSNNQRHEWLDDRSLIDLCRTAVVLQMCTYPKFARNAENVRKISFDHLYKCFYIKYVNFCL
jgi:hypothetical protein